jgi:hypothetical protein
MSHERGLDLQNALARYLGRWWPSAESTGAGRQGTDVLGIPGVVWECKTAVDFKRDFKPIAWVRQCTGHAAAGDVPVTVYWPKGIGEERAGYALSILPLHVLVRLLLEAGYGNEEDA